MHVEEEQRKSLLAPQTQLFVLGYLLLIANMFILMVGKNQFNSTTFLTIFFVIITFVISTYVVNCTVVGQCHIYAWIVAYAMVILSVVSVINSLYILQKN